MLLVEREAASISDRRVKPYLVIVDDAVNFAESLQLVLEDDFEVSIAHSVAEAMQSFRTKLPDVALIDMQLPDGDGLDLLRELRHYRKRPVSIVMTAYSSEENSAEAFQEGAADYISKPFNIEQLKKHIFERLAGDPLSDSK